MTSTIRKFELSNITRCLSPRTCSTRRSRPKRCREHREITHTSPESSKYVYRDILNKTKFIRKLDYECLMAQLKRYSSNEESSQVNASHIVSPLLPHLKVQQRNRLYSPNQQIQKSRLPRIFSETIERIEKDKTKKLVFVLEDVHKKIEALAASRVSSCRTKELLSPRNLKRMCRKLLAKRKQRVLLK
ncbi:unnamed protein product [Moneuplotes crassus]|uniref:Uncharacterized protein n=1 Tax=Euplotes crassus TaxID=5936 RepID=A0AAD1XXP2_EUPCR|nr:unnamed protein product [Moneuplotes crassus]